MTGCLLRSVASSCAATAEAGYGSTEVVVIPSSTFQVGRGASLVRLGHPQQHGPAGSKTCLGIGSGRRPSQEITRLMALNVEYH